MTSSKDIRIALINIGCPVNTKEKNGNNIQSIIELVLFFVMNNDVISSNLIGSRLYNGILVKWDMAGIKRITNKRTRSVMANTPTK